MKIDVSIKVDEDAVMNGTSNELASGWVEIEDCFKFPVKVRKYTDKTDGKEKMFVTYPQRKTDHGYEAVFHPVDKAVKKEIEECVLENMQKNIVKGIQNVPITNVQIHLLESEKQNTPVKIRGLATVEFAGFQINGVMIKEGKNGLFVQMPQHKVGGEYRDTVYGTNASMQYAIKDEVLNAYEKELQMVQEPKQPEPEKQQNRNTVENVANEKVQDVSESEPLEWSEGIELFLTAYELGDLQGMIAVLENLNMETDSAILAENQQTIQKQYAYVYIDEYVLAVRFQSDFVPERDSSSEEVKQEIQAFVHKDGSMIASQVLYEKNSYGADAEKAYQEMIGQWKKLTNQESIVQGKVKEEAKHPDMSVQSPKL